MSITSQSGVYNPHSLFDCSSFDGMESGSRSRDQYIMLNVRFKDDLSCSTNEDWRLLNMIARFMFVDQSGFLLPCRLLMMVGGKDGHWVRVPWNNFTLGWGYTANEFADK